VLSYGVLASEIQEKAVFLDLAMDVENAFLAKSGKRCQDFFCKKVFTTDCTDDTLSRSRSPGMKRHQMDHHWRHAAIAQ